MCVIDSPEMDWFTGKLPFLASALHRQLDGSPNRPIADFSALHTATVRYALEGIEVFLVQMLDIWNQRQQQYRNARQGKDYRTPVDPPIVEFENLSMLHNLEFRIRPQHKAGISKPEIAFSAHCASVVKMVW